MLQRLDEEYMDFAPRETDTWKTHNKRACLDKTSLQTTTNIMHAGIRFITKTTSSSTVPAHSSDTDTHPKRRFSVSWTMGRNLLKWSSSHVENLLYEWKGLTIFMKKENIQSDAWRYDNLASPEMYVDVPFHHSESAIPTQKTLPHRMNRQKQ